MASSVNLQMLCPVRPLSFSFLHVSVVESVIERYPFIPGRLKQATSGFGAGLLVLAAALSVLAALVATLRIPREGCRGSPGEPSWL